MPGAFAVGLVALVGVAACRGAGNDLPPPPASVKVLPETVVVKHGAIGVQDRQDATYVLVQGENGSAEDRMVSLEGVLVDAAGKPLGKLFLDELRVPAGEQRTFALVAAGSHLTATGARVKVHTALLTTAPPVAIVKELVTERTAKGLAATATIENRVENVAIATVIVTFFDAQGKILSRPFAPVQLLGRSTRPFTFDGPMEAVRAEAFVGDTAH